jgi:hypothetical protein
MWASASVRPRASKATHGYGSTRETQVRQAGPTSKGTDHLKSGRTTRTTTKGRDHRGTTTVTTTVTTTTTLLSYSPFPPTSLSVAKRAGAPVPSPEFPCSHWTLLAYQAKQQAHRIPSKALHPCRPSSAPTGLPLAQQEGERLGAGGRGLGGEGESERE